MLANLGISKEAVWVKFIILIHKSSLNSTKELKVCVTRQNGENQVILDNIALAHDLKLKKILKNQRKEILVSRKFTVNSG